MKIVIKNIILSLLIVGWFIATVVITLSIIGIILLIVIDEWWGFPIKILDKIE